jgi:hypothetical protein
MVCPPSLSFPLQVSQSYTLLQYILGLVRAKPLYLVLFLLILGAAFLFTLFWVLVLPLFTLQSRSIWCFFFS